MVRLVVYDRATLGNEFKTMVVICLLAMERKIK